MADIRTVEPVGYGVNGSFRELMVQLNDSVPHTINIVTAGNPPGQPIEVALEAGKTVSFPMPETYHDDTDAVPERRHTYDRRQPQFQGGTDLGPPEGRSGSVETVQQRRTRRSLYADGAGLPGRYGRVPAVADHDERKMVWTLSGHTFLTERYAGDANRKNSIHIGIAERYDLVVPQAGGPRLQPGDYIHFNGRSSKFSEGAWGILRVLDKEVPDLQKLPAGYSGRNVIPQAPAVCPADAPVKSFNVAAIDFPSMKLNPKAPDAIEVDFERTIQMVNPEAKIYALGGRRGAVASGAQPMPLTLRANVGDCLKVKLTNRMKESRASFSAIGLAFDPKDSPGRERRQQSRRSDCRAR